ncbi:hypothetical protein pf16_94 [Pseudomonas phage pf16]|uniref:GIY-YIG domain-containing protein n=1 Tax=Pseudomonas phage pf16 TaxID=1815630 RepID=A0A1S5R3N2_9CAUD|nr:homing endonuclease [Pseudomonas phage pf16]AND75017.1 hypothetical protein pf16_94 [Pseudomonas phage pf16]
MYYIVYETINKINGKVYIGKHKTTNMETDRYIGSGNLIKQAIKKYGEENFERSIIFCAFTEEDAFEVERILVDEEFVRRVDTYNLATGGRGGYTMSEEFCERASKRMMGEGNPNFGKPRPDHSKKKQSDAMKGRTLSDEHKSKISEAVRGENHPNFGKHHSEETRMKLRESNLGVPRSDETRARMSESHKGLKQSQETKDKRAAHHIGVKRSDEARQRMSDARKNAPMVTCPHCNKTAKRSGRMTFNHFDNCKQRVQVTLDSYLSEAILEPELELGAEVVAEF